MTTCLIALGSNLGDRNATLEAAIDALIATPGVQLLRHSRWQETKPVGGWARQPGFLNGAAVLETSHEPATFHQLLQQIETRHGRQRHERWADRTLDLDLLLYGDQTIDTPALTVPHPRMSFRRFVLEPAAEIAGSLVHPTIGWTLDKLLQHLDAGADCVAIVSPQESARRDLAAMLRGRFGMTDIGPSLVNEQLWPAAATIWLAVPSGRVSSEHPKLTILLGPPESNQTGRGPTLQIPATSRDSVVHDAFAAVEAVWPRLGPLGRERLQ